MNNETRTAAALAADELVGISSSAQANRRLSEIDASKAQWLAGSFVDGGSSGDNANIRRWTAESHQDADSVTGTRKRWKLRS